MLQNDVAQAGRFTSKSAGHYNRLTLRNGVSLNGLTRNPLDLEIFFQTALFFVSRAARESVLGQETFLARLHFVRSHHVACRNDRGNLRVDAGVRSRCTYR